MRVRRKKVVAHEEPLVVERITNPSIRTANTLRELADLVERSGIHTSSFDVEDKAFFKRGEDIEMLSITHVIIDLKILRNV